MRTARIPRCLVLAAMLGLVGASAATAQDAAAVLKTNAATAKGAKAPRKADIEALNSQKASSGAIVQPSSKAAPGSASRGAASALFTYDNWTAYWIRCYFNDDFAGVVAPFGDITVSVTRGRAIVYCEAPGTANDWGPADVSNPPTGTWELHN